MVFGAHDISGGGGTSSLNATEIDLWAEYSHGLGPKVTGTLGSVLYLFPNESGLTNEFTRTVEVYGKLQAAAPINPKLAILNDEFTRITKPAVSKDAKAWAGVTLSWSKALTGAPAPTSE